MSSIERTENLSEQEPKIRWFRYLETAGRKTYPVELSEIYIRNVLYQNRVESLKKNNIFDSEKHTFETYLDEFKTKYWAEELS